MDTINHSQIRMHQMDIVVEISVKEKNIKVIKNRYTVRDILDALWYSYPNYTIEIFGALYIRKDDK